MIIKNKKIKKKNNFYRVNAKVEKTISYVYIYIACFAYQDRPIHVDKKKYM